MIKRPLKRLLLPGLLASIAASAPLAARGSTRVETTAGRIEGRLEAGRVEAFLGVPYADPPVGDNRWREPRELSPWRGVRGTKALGPACMQTPAGAWGPYTAEFLAAGPFSEDCLTLNVWKPARVRGKLPVLVFIHGGAFAGGGSNVPAYNGAALASRGMVVVTINYRVGVFGFLAHPALTAEAPNHTSGNYGLLDQIAALKWVRDNADRFSGDPERITVSGESAGAASVNDLIVSPLAKGLFHRAISFSGASMAIDAPSLTKGEADGVALAANAGVQDIVGLRALSAEYLVEATGMKPGNGPPRLVFAPHVDGVVLPFDPDAADKPIVTNAPLMTGFNSAEMIDTSVKTPTQFEAAVRARYGASAERLLALYPHGTDAEAAASNALIARDRYMSGLILWARERTRNSGQRVFAYLYDHAYPAVSGEPSWGAFHSSQLPYVFGTITSGKRTFTREDQRVVAQWHDRLLAFARSGSPGKDWISVASDGTSVMGLGDREGMLPAVSSPERFEAFRAFAADGGKLGLV